MVKHFAAGFLMLSVLLGNAQPAYADERSAALVKRFERFCIQKTPNFERLDQGAQKSNWRTFSDRTPSLPDGHYLHSKSWVLKDDTGPYEFGISVNTKGTDHTESCGIGAADVSADAVRDDLVNNLKLGAPERETESADGKRTLTFWHAKAGGVPVTIMFTQDKGDSSKGIFMNAYARTGEN